MSGGWFRRRIADPLLGLLRQGVTPERLAWSVALGVTLGLTPVVGVTTGLCALAALVLRLNVGAMQAVNYLVFPLQFALLLPLTRAGEWMTGAEPAALSAAMSAPWVPALHALLAWAILAAPATLVIYAAALYALRRMRGVMEVAR